MKEKLIKELERFKPRELCDLLRDFIKENKQADDLCKCLLILADAFDDQLDILYEFLLNENE